MKAIVVMMKVTLVMVMMGVMMVVLLFMAVMVVSDDRIDEDVTMIAYNHE